MIKAKKQLVKKEEQRMIKTMYLFFLSSLCIHNITTLCMDDESLKDYYNQKIYFPVIQHTHQINLFFQRFLSFDQTNSLCNVEKEITSCCKRMEKLSKVITDDFDSFQRKNVKNIFKCMKKQASKTEKDIITTQVINQLKWPHSTRTNSLGNSIASSLRAIQAKIFGLKAINSVDTFYDNLRTIYQEYQQFLTSLNPDVYHQVEGVPEVNLTVAGALQATLNSLTTPQQERANLLCKKECLHREIQQNPYLYSSYLRTISVRAHKLSWVPFLDTKYVIRKIIILTAGEDAYNTAKKSFYFKAVRLLQKNDIIHLRPICSKTRELLETSSAQFFIKLQEGQCFVQHSCNLQEYFFIELLETISKAHHNSLKMIGREKRFSFVLEKNEKIEEKNQKMENRELDDVPAQNISTGSIWTKDNVINSLVSIPRIIASTDFNAVKNTAINTTKLFFSSMLPWYTPPQPTNFIGNNPQQIIKSKQIVPQPVMGNIKEFLSLLNSIELFQIGAHRIGAHRKCLRTYEQIKFFTQIVNVHEALVRNIRIQYGLKAVRDKTLPTNWDELSSKIDSLYATLNKLKENRKQLWFFDLWGRLLNAVERNTTIKLLKKYIELSNETKINTYLDDLSEHYGTIRQNFLRNCTFSHADNIDLLRETTKNNSLFKQYVNVFSPLEQRELRQVIK